MESIEENEAISDNNTSNDDWENTYDSRSENDNSSDEGPFSDSDEESFDSNVVDSPGKTTKMWRPKVRREFMVDVDACFQTEKEAQSMYSLYAENGGFDVRLNTTRRFGDETVKEKYIVCNRNGKIPNRSVDTLDTDSSGRKRRNFNFHITECKAHIIFERKSVKSPVFTIKKFIELHNHPLQDKEERKHSKRARKLTYFDKELIVRCSTSNIGATKAHNLQASLRGGYDKVGPEVIDYKNFKKKMGNIIGDRDAQMLVDKMEQRKKEMINYSFEYKSVDNVLNAIFWVDETAKMYYKEFGDVISFDATLRTNKYDMIFVPFTAIDNHKRSVNIGAALLSNEIIESYRWLLESFLKAHGKPPALVLTDQDPAILQAVEGVFPDSKHRLCMWHIMKKLKFKVTEDLYKNSDFRKRFNKLVWNVYLQPNVFEKRWDLLMEEFNLTDKRWFNDLYTMRKMWIPANFKDMPRHGLMKTTSRSESANSFFNKYAHHGNYLIYFMMSFDMAIEKQRNTHRKLESDSKKARKNMTTMTKLERHAFEVYTNTIFLEVKKEIKKGDSNCSIDSMETFDGWQVIRISHYDKEEKLKIGCNVEMKMPEKIMKCSCHLFLRMGILCRHIFTVMKNYHIEKIPEEYIVRRWRKDVISSHLLVSKHGCEETDDETFQLIAEFYSNMEHVLDVVKSDKARLQDFVEKSREMRKVVDEGNSKEGECATEEEEIIKMLGVRIPEAVEIHAPASITNKGSGTKKRLASASEKGASRAKGKTRKCGGCGEYINHNWRSCPVRHAREAAEAAESSKK